MVYSLHQLMYSAQERIKWNQIIKEASDRHQVAMSRRFVMMMITVDTPTNRFT